MIRHFRLYLTARALHFLIKFSPVKNSEIAAAFIAVGRQYNLSKKLRSLSKEQLDKILDESMKELVDLTQPKENASHE